MNNIIKLGTIGDFVNHSVESPVWNNFYDELAKTHNNTNLVDMKIIKKELTQYDAEIFIASDREIFLNFKSENHKIMFMIKYG